MNVLIIQEAGRNVENAFLRECFAIQHAFQENGHTAIVWGLNHPNFHDDIDFDSFDLIFTLENYSLSWLPDFSKITRPIKVQWLIDLHCSREDYSAISSNCDYILHSTKNPFLQAYRQLFPNKNHVWFPNGVDDRFFYPTNTIKDKDVCFIASNIGNRDQISSNLGIKRQFLLGYQMIDEVRRNKIQFNCSISPYDVNYRCWETISLGTNLVTNFVPDLEALGFKNGHNCFIYKNLDEAKDQIDNLLKHSDLRVEMAYNANLLACNNSYKMRIKNLLSQIS